MTTPHDDLRRLGEVLQEYDRDFQECRSCGHQWSPDTAQWLADGTVERILLCIRCLATRVQILDRHGYVIRGRYSYEKGYRLSGFGRMNAEARALIRWETTRRMLSA